MRINEIFYSLQGEGRFTGVAAVFVRLSGCNLHCWFCDTQHQEGREMSEEQIVAEASRFPSRHVVITGGEPTLQLNARLTQLLHQAGFFIQIETNGTHALAEGCEVDWVTCSPKHLVTTAEGASTAPIAPIRLTHIDELKVVFESPRQDMSPYEQIPASELRLQPCDVQDAERNSKILHATIQYILDHPQWQLSLQTHKLLDIQ